MAYVWSNLTNSAAWPVRDGAAAVVHDGKMFLLGGINTSTLNDVWSSTDGVTWAQVTSAAPWSGRHSMPAVSFGVRIYVLGGDFISGGYLPDVWSSADGATWTCETSAAPWGNRVLHFAAAFGGYIWVFGGQTHTNASAPPTTFFCDAWRSSDGANWQQVGGVMPWGLRSGICGSAVLNGELFAIGGGAYDTTDYPTRVYRNDVWATADGINWRLVTPRTLWAPRIYHSIEVCDGRLWMMGGNNAPTANGDLNDIWSSADGVSWRHEGDGPWTARHAAALFSYGGALYLVSGSNYAKDVWKMTVDNFHYGQPPDSTTGWGALYTILDRSMALDNGANVTSIGVLLNASHTSVKIKIAKENSPGNYDIVYSGAAFNHPGGGYADQPVTFSVPSTGTYRVGISADLPSSPAEAFSTIGARAMAAGDATGSGVSLPNQTDGTICMRWAG